MKLYNVIILQHLDRTRSILCYSNLKDLYRMYEFYCAEVNENRYLSVTILTDVKNVYL